MCVLTLSPLPNTQAVRQLLTTTTPEEAQKALTAACIESLFVYRKHCASQTSAGQLILPEPLKLLPLCTLGMIKNTLFQPGVNADERSFLFAYVNSMPTYVSVAFVCPRLFSLSELPEDCCVPHEDDGRVLLPSALTLSSQSIQPQNLYLLDNGRYMYLYVGEAVNPAVYQQAFGVEPAAGAFHTPFRSSDDFALGSRIVTMIDHLRGHKPNFQNLQIVKQSRQGYGVAATLDETQFQSHLIEDTVNVPVSSNANNKSKDANGKNPNTMSYIDFLCWVHKRIQNRFY